MPKELGFSSFECDCGHLSHFSENTVREMKAKSMNREVLLGDSEPDEHTIVFESGKMIAVLCSKKESR
jgi:hypothetical protein